MKEFIITFGFGHHDEENGSLSNCCTRITAESEVAARVKVSSIRGQKWSNSYGKEEGEGMIKRYHIREIPFKEIGPQIGGNL